ncbi:MAG: adenosine kinase [Planctomycetaceae bacterium]
MKYDVYGVGNALVDIQATVKDETLDSLGFAKGAMTLVDDKMQAKVLTKIDSGSTNRCAGGSAANTIMGVVDLGGKAAYVGKVAQDPIGKFFLQDMRDRGVVIEVPPSAEGDSGTSVILITEDAQRTMLTNLGVSIALDTGDIDEDELKRSQYVYVEGYLFSGEQTRAAAIHAIELAKKNDVKVALTVSDAFLIDMVKDEFWDLIKGPVDLLFCNEQEARSLTGEDDAIECAHVIHRHAADVALTLGENGSLLMHDGQVIPVEGVGVNAIDTTGAGDMYAAGLLYGITNGLSWKQAGHLASNVAGKIVSQLGARLPRSFTADEVSAMTE